ncbi:DNA polymerase III subunit delta [Ferruginibacter lapsinanis]|uniref:DNA polymerase III subunit delta n=1 Tax=Ferruginibacter lapsinanis TaxID=563172 RepID=UPI001E3B84C9|nr:DNA polymerase III subunit delta [Ferruginibacter lapsinanis]UEG48718.1 DNA polymerase III subunit delta [Ferruginibacter lapsinanis]
MSAEKIINDWKKKLYKPVYWLEGEEDYYIDKVMDYAEHQILPESEAGFNLSVFYGKDAAWSDVVNACMRYPMFAEKQVVLLKEAQQMRDIEKLENYIENPLASTIFVVSYKEKTLDKRKTLYKTIKKDGEIFTSEKIKDYNLTKWITDYVQSQSFSMSAKAVQLLADHIGSDLSRIVNEIEKITVNLGQRKSITEDDIERYVGVSKEYNAFELQNAVAKKDLAKAIRIIQYFEANPKAAPIQLILPSLYGFFSKLYVYFGMADKSENGIKGLFYNNPYAAKEAITSAKLYSYTGVEQALLLLHEYNLKSVGINDNGTSDASLLKELVVKMMN